MTSVNSSNKRIALNTIMLYFRMLLITIVSLYTSRIILNKLGFQDFGIYNVVGGFVIVLGFLNSAMSAATQRFISFELGRSNSHKLKKVFSTALIIHFIISVIILLISETIGLWFINTQLSIPPNRVYATNWVYQFSILTFVMNVLTVPYNATIIAHEKMSIYAYVSILEVLLKLVIAFLIGYCNSDKLIIYSLLTFVVSFIIRSIYQLYCKIKYTECKFQMIWDKAIFINMISFSGWSIFGGIAYLARSQGVNVILNIFYGTLLNAAWGISQQVNTAVLSFIQNFTTAINPPITKSYANNDLDNFQNLLFGGMKYSFYLSFCIIIPLLYETDFVLYLWLSNIPNYTIIYVKLVLICILIEVFSQTIGTAIQAIGKIKWYQIVIGGILFLNFPLSYIAIKLTNNPISVMYIAIVTSIVSIIVRFVFLFFLVHIPSIPFIRLLRFVVLLFISIIPVYIVCLEMEQNILRLLVRILLTFLTASVVLYIWGMSISEKFFFKRKIQSLFKFCSLK